MLQAVIIFYTKIKLSHKENKCLPRLRLFVCLSPQPDLAGPDPLKYKHWLRVLHVTVRMGPGQVHAIIFIGG